MLTHILIPWSKNWIAFQCEYHLLSRVLLLNSGHLFALSEKEREHADLDDEATAANKSLQHAEMSLSNSKAQLKAKRDELKGMFIRTYYRICVYDVILVLERKLKADVDHESLDIAIKEAVIEVDFGKEYVPSVIC